MTERPTLALPVELEPYRSRIEATARPFVRLVPKDEPTTSTQSKIGGTPYQPEGFAWPMRGDDRLGFVAQVNLAELPPLPELPTAGILQLFVHADLDIGFEHADEDWRLLWWPEVQESDERPTSEPALMPLGGATDRMHTPRRLVGELGWQPISDADQTFDELLGDELLGDELSTDLLDFFTPPRPSHQLGGWPNFVQDDPRWDATKDFVLLLQIDSDEDADVEWGDDGVGNVLIEPSDLAARDFSRTALTSSTC